MLTISNSNELTKLMQQGKVTQLLGKKILQDLANAREEYEAEDEELGVTIILEGTETEDDFQDLGLEDGHLGAWGALCEWVNILQLEEEKYYYFCIVMNNSFAAVFYSQAGNYSQTNPELEAWLKKETSNRKE